MSNEPLPQPSPSPDSGSAESWDLDDQSLGQAADEALAPAEPEPPLTALQAEERLFNAALTQDTPTLRRLHALHPSVKLTDEHASEVLKTHFALRPSDHHDLIIPGTATREILDLIDPLQRDSFLSALTTQAFDEFRKKNLRDDVFHRLTNLKAPFDPQAIRATFGELFAELGRILRAREFFTAHSLDFGTEVLKPHWQRIGFFAETFSLSIQPSDLAKMGAIPKSQLDDELVRNALPPNFLTRARDFAGESSPVAQQVAEDLLHDRRTIQLERLMSSPHGAEVKLDSAEVETARDELLSRSSFGTWSTTQYDSSRSYIALARASGTPPAIPASLMAAAQARYWDSYWSLSNHPDYIGKLDRDPQFEAAIGLPREMSETAFSLFRFLCRLNITPQQSWFELQNGQATIPSPEFEKILLAGIDKLRSTDSARPHEKFTVHEFIEGSFALRDVTGQRPPLDRDVVAKKIRELAQGGDGYSAASLFLWDWAYHGARPDCSVAASLHADLFKIPLLRGSQPYPPQIVELEVKFDFHFDFTEPQPLSAWLQRQYADVPELYAQQLFLNCLQRDIPARHVHKTFAERWNGYAERFGVVPDVQSLKLILENQGVPDPAAELVRRVNETRRCALNNIGRGMESLRILDEVFGVAQLSEAEAQEIYADILMQLFPYETEGEHQAVYWADVGAALAYVKTASSGVCPTSDLIQRAYTSYFSHSNLSVGGIERLEQLLAAQASPATVREACREALTTAAQSTNDESAFGTYDSICAHYRTGADLTAHEVQALYRKSIKHEGSGANFAQVLQRTHVRPSDEIIRKYILGNQMFRAALHLPLSDEILDQHFSNPGHQDDYEFDRVYEISGSRRYFDRLIETFEAAPEPLTLPRHINLLTAMARRDMSDEKRFAELFSKISAFRTALTPELVDTLAQSYVRLINAGADHLQGPLFEVIHERARAEGAAAETPLTTEQRFCLKVVTGQYQASEDHLLLLPLLSHPGVDLEDKKSLLRIFNAGDLLPAGMERRIQRAINKTQDFDWQDVSYILEIQKIPSMEVRDKARVLLSELYFESDNSPGIDSVSRAHDPFRIIPSEAFAALLVLSTGSSEQMNSFAKLFATTKGKQSRDELVYGLVQLAFTTRRQSWDHSALVQTLAPFCMTPDSTADIANILRGAAFLATVSDLIASDDHSALDLAAHRSRTQVLNITGTGLAEIRANLREQIAQKIQELLPDERINAEHIERLTEHWSSLEPLFTYAGKLAQGAYTKEVAYLAQMVANFDPPDYKKWTAWRYSERGDTSNDAEIHSSPYSLEERKASEWQKNRFCDLGTVWVNSGIQDPGPAVLNFLRHAARHNHIVGPGEEQKPFRILAEQVAPIFLAVDGEPESAARIISESIDKVRSAAREIDTILQAQSLKRLRDILSAASGPMQINGKQKSNFGFLEQFLSEAQVLELRAILKQVEDRKQSSVPGSELLPLPLQQTLRDRATEIEQAYESVLTRNSLQAWGVSPSQLSTTGQLYTVRQQVAAALSLLELCNLRAPDAVAGRISTEGKELPTVFKELRAAFKGNLTFLQDLENIERACTVKQETQTRRNLGILFTDDPEILLQIGKYPIGCGSCQNYEGDPQLNCALLGYMGDPHIKAALLVDLGRLSEASRKALAKAGGEVQPGEIPVHEILHGSIARTVVKLVGDSSEQPAIFLEPTYTSINKANFTFDKYFNLFFHHMVAKHMDVRVMRGGGAEETFVPASYNPSGQYEDSAAGNAQNAGMGIKIGLYSMPSHTVLLDTPVTPEEIEMAERVSSSSSSRRIQ
ncbi:MAG: hypothetical protein J0M12_09475 [Deltaproteobacteria bacterium]|nr:hypothetical protein [Deltaproteobacteria bacterium]